MTSGSVGVQQTRGRATLVGKAVWKSLRFIGQLPGNIRSYFSDRGGWFWIPVSFVLACSTTASSIVFMGAVLAGRQEGRLGLTIFLYLSGVIVILGPVVLMARIIDSVRAWVDPNFDESPPEK